jgi:hypothetical protein
LTRGKRGTGRIASAVAVVALVAAMGGYVLYTYVLKDTKKSASTRTVAASGTVNKPSGTNSSKTTTVTTSSTEYDNSRYGFKTEQPVDWTRKSSQNGDGVTLTSPDGKAVIRTYGFLNAAEQSLPEVYSSMEADRRSMFPDLTVVEKKEGLINNHPDIEVVWTYTDKQVESPFSGPVTTKVVITLKGEAGLGLDYTALAADYDTYIGVFSSMMADYKLR